MGPLFIITLQPFGTDLSHLLQRLEHRRIEDFRPICPVIPLDRGILIRLAWLDVPQLNRPFRAPGGKPVGEKFGTVVYPEAAIRSASLL